MTKSEALLELRRLQPALRELGVRSIAIFGSVMRDEAGVDSDLDLVAEFEQPYTAKQYFDTLFLIEDSLGVSVDLAEPTSLHPGIRDTVLNEALYVA